MRGCINERTKIRGRSTRNLSAASRNGKSSDKSAITGQVGRKGKNEREQKALSRSRALRVGIRWVSCRDCDYNPRSCCERGYTEIQLSRRLLRAIVMANVCAIMQIRRLCARACPSAYVSARIAARSTCTHTHTRGDGGARACRHGA